MKKKKNFRFILTIFFSKNKNDHSSYDLIFVVFRKKHLFRML